MTTDSQIATTPATEQVNETPIEVPSTNDESPTSAVESNKKESSDTINETAPQSTTDAEEPKHVASSSDEETKTSISDTKEEAMQESTTEASETNENVEAKEVPVESGKEKTDEDKESPEVVKDATVSPIATEEGDPVNKSESKDEVNQTVKSSDAETDGLHSREQKVIQKRRHLVDAATGMSPALKIARVMV